ncbi:MAG: cytochrome oxidase putative small subunit CydP [Alphaproteobacteria bacterium]
MFGGPLAKEITAALVFKVAALLLLYFAFFAPSDAPQVTPAPAKGRSRAAAASRESRLRPSPRADLPGFTTP